MANAVYNGRKTESRTVYVELGNVDGKYRNSWVDAYVKWNQLQSKRIFTYRSGATSLLTARSDANNPNSYGRIIYNHSNNSYSTPFHSYLNTYRSAIVNNADVRISVASHELGHALRLLDLQDVYSIMDTKRNRQIRIYATSFDVSNINKLY